MVKKKKTIQLTDVLDALKLSIVDLYQRKHVKVSSAIAKAIAQIDAVAIEREAGSRKIRKWINANEYFGVTDHEGYLTWLRMEVDERVEKGELEVFLAKQTADDRKAWKEFIEGWNLIHSIFLTQLPIETLQLYDEYSEQQHFIGKSQSFTRSHVTISNAREEVRFETHDFVQKMIRAKGTALNGNKPASVFQSKIAPNDWLVMLNNLSSENYLDYVYINDESLFRSWLVHHLSFNKFDMNVPPANSPIKLKWTGQLMALAEWLMLIRYKMVEYSGVSNAKLLKWADEAIEYEGDRAKLIHAISKLKNYPAKFFTCSVEKNEFQFRINHNVRLSRKVKT